ncbi:hypothetical protein JJB98_23160 [Bradyrhizobium diazoefficiens]|nr:hypothetical protein [Bradyrhizobium diazoefficiens]QQO22621.1 hypothetical protein JJB98_23160 [Bradyrhizobium diazoefficiens]
MTENTKLPGRRCRHGGSRHAGAGSALAITQKRIAAHAGIDNTAWRIKRPPNQPWPFKAVQTPPLQWWRTLPSDGFRDAEQLLLLKTLERIRVLRGGDDPAAALCGDPAAAIGVAFTLMPIEEFTLEVDIAMTALLRCALERNAAAALVLAQIVGLTEFEHEFATELAASWYVHGRRHSANPRQFSEAEAVLLSAFRQRHRDGENA